MTLEKLTPCYGADIARSIMAYWTDFEVFADSFLPVVPTIVENNSTRLVLLRCPLDLHNVPPGHAHGKSGASTSPPVLAGVLFTPQFPSRPPVCALILEPGTRLVPPANLPWLGSNMTVKYAHLPGLSNPTNPSLMELLLAITSALAETPFTEAPPPQTTPAPPPSLPQQSTPSPAVQYAAQSSPVVQQPPPQQQAPLSGPQGAAAALLDAAAAAALTEFIVTKEQSVRRRGELLESRTTLERLKASLDDKERVLTAALPQLAQAEATATQLLADSATMDPLSYLDAQDPLRGQAVELLAEVMALEDLVDLYEKRLRKGAIQTPVYLRLVADAARRQFLAKYKLKKLHGIATAKQSFAALSNRFPQLDRDLVLQVLSENNYAFAEAARSLSEMVRAA